MFFFFGFTLHSENVFTWLTQAATIQKPQRVVVTQTVPLFSCLSLSLPPPHSKSYNYTFALHTVCHNLLVLARPPPSTSTSTSLSQANLNNRRLLHCLKRWELGGRCEHLAKAFLQRLSWSAVANRHRNQLKLCCWWCWLTHDHIPGWCEHESAEKTTTRML